MVLVFILRDSRCRPVPRLFPDLRAGDAANPGRGPLSRTGDERVRPGMESDVLQRLSAEYRGVVDGTAPGARGRRGDRVSLRVAVAGARDCVEKPGARSQTRLNRRSFPNADYRFPGPLLRGKYT